MLEEWDKVKLSSDPPIPVGVCPLGVEPKKPRGLWDGRYVNEYCRDIPFTMDNAAKIAEVSWKDAYLFKIDHKNGYFHVSLHKKSWKFFGVYWKGKVLCPYPKKYQPKKVSESGLWVSGSGHFSGIPFQKIPEPIRSARVSASLYWTVLGRAKVYAKIGFATHCNLGDVNPMISSLGNFQHFGLFRKFVFSITLG